MNLRYDMIHANTKHGEDRHPQIVLAEIGIEYLWSTPQSICDQWWLWGCSNIPDILPDYITALDVDPSHWVPEKIAKRIKKPQPKTRGE